MEESERTVTSLFSESIEFKDLLSQLVNLPHIVEYIQKLEEQITLQNENIVELKDKLANHEKEINVSKNILVDNETQTDCVEKSKENETQTDCIEESKENNVTQIDWVEESKENNEAQTDSDKGSKENHATQTDWVKESKENETQTDCIEESKENNVTQIDWIEESKKNNETQTDSVKGSKENHDTQTDWVKQSKEKETQTDCIEESKENNVTQIDWVEESKENNETQTDSDKGSKENHATQTDWVKESKENETQADRIEESKENNVTQIDWIEESKKNNETQTDSVKGSKENHETQTDCIEDSKENNVTQIGWVEESKKNNETQTDSVKESKENHETQTDWVKESKENETQTDCIEESKENNETQTDSVKGSKENHETQTDWVKEPKENETQTVSVEEPKENNETQTDWVNESKKNNETQTDWVEESKEKLQDWSTNKENATKIVDQVTEAAESAMIQTGFVYEQTTGLYYDYNSGYYYDAKSGLYYNGHTGTYYYYDKDTKSHKFHSQVYNKSNEASQKLPSAKRKKKKRRDENKDRVKKFKPSNDNQSEPEEGLCTDTEDEESSQEDSLGSPSNDSEKDEDASKIYPPCMRIIVKETNLTKLKVGYLFIVTITGGSIGREGDHSVIIPDINISKHHAKLQYNETDKSYEIIDLGSRNGTVLNNKRLSAAKQESDPTKVVHGSILQLGSTKLLCHIHDGHETCGHCEPGLLQSDSPGESVVFIKKSHQSELRRLKNKFGLDEDNTKTASRVAPGYLDRAHSRRKDIGSSSQFTKTEQSSLDESISKSNVGFKMLSKMGWSEGMSLGKSGDGLTEPVPLVQNMNKAGLGASENQILSVQVDPSTEKKQAMWKKAQQRFNDITK